jgi:hypothetical protein
VEAGAAPLLAARRSQIDDARPGLATMIHDHSPKSPRGLRQHWTLGTGVAYPNLISL